MIKGFKYGLLVCGVLVLPRSLYAQNQNEEPEINVEESAEVFLEAYNDDFQVNFFEALKQKGIENYDRAVNFLLECKKLDAGNSVIDHELAKVYLNDKKYTLAQEYALVAVRAEPENLWYLDTLVKVLDKQGNTIDNLQLGTLTEASIFQQNLAIVFFNTNKYESALSVLKNLKKTPFLDDLTSKINDSLRKKNEKGQIEIKTTVINNSTESTSTIEDYKRKIENYIASNSIDALTKISNDALESFPSQPYFYFAQGYALNKSGNHKSAIDILEASLDFFVGDDIPMANKIFTELSEAYNGINNSVKANMYLRKIKPGF